MSLLKVKQAICWRLIVRSLTCSEMSLTCQLTCSPGYSAHLKFILPRLMMRSGIAITRACALSSP